MGPREVAARILMERFSRAATLDQLFSMPEFTQLSDRDRRLAMQLVYGVLRSLKQLDYFIETLSSRSLRRIQNEVTWTLRIALYELNFLRVPAYATLNEAVELARRLGRARASGFINGILRSFERKRPDLPSGNSASDLAVQYSHPKWLVDRYLQRYGLEMSRRLMARNNLPPPGYLWVNLRKTGLSEVRTRLARDGIESRMPLALPGCLLVEDANLAEHPLYQEGHCFYMDPASQEVAGLLSMRDVGCIADVCTAPGNKAFLLAARAAPGTLFLAGDNNPVRIRSTRERARLYGFSELQFLILDAERPFPFGPVDAVLCDVPCSGLGTIRSNPDIRWAVQEQMLPVYRKRQQNILRQSLAAVRPGGRALYATCSTEPEENEEVVRSVVDEDPSVELKGVPVNTYHPAHPGEGFYAALLKKGPTNRTNLDE